ncbi:hypothetical protein AMS68_008035 [Peltaster fructicola]|uniref:CCHC-type domain-containing protein n=1 Tax=Peltaster fructicola TaxID=286661 RepID=A0A6H0Y6N4_9PEZI|nr:hypothetical protein AMS68_008035 [Peltaster fructicola]
MQRAAATPKASPDTTPDNRSAKRRRLSNGSCEASPVPAPGSDAEAIQQVLAEEDRKRQEAVDREAARRGETKWILDIKTPQQSRPPLMRVVSTGYADLDSNAVDSHDDDITTPQSGRRRFGTLPVQTMKADQDHSEGDVSVETDDDAEDHKPEHNRQDPIMSKELGDALRAKRDAKRKKERSKGLQQAAERRTKQSNLNQPTAISNGRRSRAPTAAICHRCGKPGHMKTNCPLKRK